jgi:hypothetical protein
MLFNKKDLNFNLKLVLILAWCVVQSLLFFKNGIFTEIEAHKYIEQANLLLNTGSVSTPNFWLYSVQIFLIATAIKLHAGFISVVLVQLFFNAVATYSLYKLLLKLSNSITAFCCLLLFICNIPFQTFNTFLYTESLFYSFIILMSCYILQLQKLTARHWFVILLWLLLICFTRPTGLLFIPAVCLYLFFKFYSTLHWSIKVGSTVLLTTLFVFVLNAALGSGGEFDFLLPFREEHIICGVPTVTQTGVTVAGENSISGILNYVAHHPGQFFYLAEKRTVAFFGLFRNYYSTGHNFYLALYFFPIYLLALLSLPGWWNKNKLVLLYCLAFIFITWGTVLLTCDDWHNRFFLTLVPFFYILSVPAFQKLIDLIRKKPAP